MTDTATATPTNVIPAGGTTQASGAMTPEWYDQLSKQFGDTTSGALTQVSNLANNWYNQPLVAGITPEQQAMIGGASSVAGQWQPGYQQGQETIAGAQPLFNSAADSASQITSGLAPAQGMWGQAGNMMLDSADMAKQAGTYDPNQLQQHLNPYINGALNSMYDVSNRNLMNNILPGVNQTFTGSGLFGSSRNGDFLNRAIQNQQQTTSDTAGTMLNDAYKNAQSDYYNWGQLGMQGAQNVGNQASALGNLGTTSATTTGNLFNNQANQFGAQGVNTQNLGVTQAQQALQGQTQSWDDLAKTYGYQEQGRQNTQAGLDAAYNDWQKQLTTPYSLLGGLSQMMTQFPALYKGASTQVTVPNPTQTSTLGDLTQILSALNTPA